MPRELGRNLARPAGLEPATLGLEKPAVLLSPPTCRRLNWFQDSPTDLRKPEPPVTKGRHETGCGFDGVLAVRAGVLMVSVMDHDDVAVGHLGCQPVGQCLRVGATIPINVPEPPSPPDERVIDLRKTGVHLPTTPPPVWTKGAAWSMAGQSLDPVRRGCQRARHLTRRHHHQVARVGMETDRVPFVEDPPHDRRGFFGKMTVDQKNVATAPSRLRTSRRSGVAAGFGPSSNVR